MNIALPPRQIAKVPQNTHPPFQWDDPFLLDSQLSEEERMVQQTARQYCQEKLQPRVLEAFRHERFDREIMTEFGELGLLGATLPERYGCAGMSYVVYGLVAREVERVDSGYRSAMSVQSSLVMHPIHAYGTEEQRMKYLPKLATGEWVGCFGLTEPDHGSDPGSMKTRAVETANGWRLTGSKMWITNSPIADVFVVWAKTDDGAIRGFILEKGMAGLSAPKIEGKFSLRCFADRRDRHGRCRGAARKPAAQRRRPRRAVRLPQPGALRHRLGRPWARRSSAGMPPGNTRSTASSSAGRSPRPSWSRRSSPTCRPRSPSAYRPPCASAACSTRAACRRRRSRWSSATIAARRWIFARTARDMHGANGIADEFGVIRLVMNLETVNTYEGTHDVHALILGRAQTGIQAFS